MRMMLATIIIILLSAGIGVAQRSVQDEPMQPTQPIPPDARVLTDSKEVQQQDGDAIYTWKCYTHMYAWDDLPSRYVARTCSTSLWHGAIPVNAYYVEAFGPYRVVQLDMNFTEYAKSMPVSALFNAHRASLHCDHRWTGDRRRVLRAPSAHMGYIADAPGDVPFYGFTHGHVSWPAREVLPRP